MYYVIITLENELAPLSLLTYSSDQKPTGIKQCTALASIRSVVVIDRLKNPIGPFMYYVRIF